MASGVVFVFLTSLVFAYVLHCVLCLCFVYFESVICFLQICPMGSLAFDYLEADVSLAFVFLQAVAWQLLTNCQTT